MDTTLPRRRFLQSSLALGLPALASAQDRFRTTPPARKEPATKKLAVVTSLYRYLSHSYHICGRFLNGYLKPDGTYHHPSSGIASMFVEQIGKDDLSKELAAKHGFKLLPSIEESLTLGTGKLAVDGVLLICEHGEYPYNAKGQKLYPRFEMLEKIVNVFKASGKSVPVFCDKHLSYDRTKAAQMVKWSEELKFPFIAGSSLPVTWRRPELELPLGTKMEEAMVVSRGELEIYGIHALEPLQAMVERRFDGEANQGVKSVQCLVGDEAWKVIDGDKVKQELLEACLSRSPSRNNGDMKENCRQYMALKQRGNLTESPCLFLVEYNDGLKASVLQIDGHAADETFAVKIPGKTKPESCLFLLPPPPGAAFLEALAIHVERTMETGKAALDVRRTQLAGGILEYALESRLLKGKKLDARDLDIRYAPPADSGFMRGAYAR